MMDKFEKILRDKLQGHESQMPAGEWDKFSQRLNSLKPKPNPWKSYLAGGLAAATIGVGAYLMLPSGKDAALNNSNTQTVSHKSTGVKINTHSEQSNNTFDKTTFTVENSVNEDKMITAGTPDGAIVLNNKPADHEVKNNDKLSTPVNSVNKNDRKQGSNTVNNPIDRKNENNAVNNITNVNTTNAVNNTTNAPALVTLPEPEISGAREICQNTEVSFKAANNRNDHDITWLLNGEEVSSDAELKVNFSKPGTQTLQLVYGNVQNGKRYTNASEKRIINILPAPVADIDVNKANDYSADYLFKAPAAEGNEYVWSFGDGKVQTGNDLTHAYRKKGEYNVLLTVTGSNTCKARKTEKVEIECDYNLLTANAFSPNNDGHNDVFISEALKAMPDVRFRMQIFDKSGKKIFETTRIDNPWDGRNTTNGGMCTPDAYVWRVDLTRPDGTREEYMGSVTLLPN